MIEIQRRGACLLDHFAVYSGRVHVASLAPAGLAHSRSSTPPFTKWLLQIAREITLEITDNLHKALVVYQVNRPEIGR